MAISWDSFDKIWASTSPLTPYSFSDPNYAQGWNFVGSTPPARQMWDSIQKQNDEKFKYLRDNFGTPNIVTQASQMTDTDKVYVYMGSEAGWNNGHWYYYDEGTSSWADGGVYNSVAFVTDTTLSIAGQPADAKATGDALALKSDLAGCTFTGNVGINADLSVTGDATIGTNLSVTGTSTLTGNVSAGADLSVTGASTLNSLSVSGTTALTGTSTAPTPSADDNSTKIATTEYVQTEIKPIEADVSANDKRISNIEKLLQGNLYDYQTDSDSKYVKTVPAGAMPWASLEQIGGKTLVWNQTFALSMLRGNTTFYGVTSERTDNGIRLYGAFTSGINFSVIGDWNDAVVGHKYLITNTPISESLTLRVTQDGAYANWQENTPFTATDTHTYIAIRPLTLNVNFDVTWTPQIFDLTLMFGAGNEPSTYEEFQQMFPASYYPYNAGTLLSADVTEVESRYKTVVWNQLVVMSNGTSVKNGITYTFTSDGTVVINGTATAIADSAPTAFSTNLTIGHVYWLRGCPADSSASTYYLNTNNGQCYADGLRFTADSSTSRVIHIRVESGVTANNVTFKVQCTDLTLMFGAGNEPTLEECRTMFPAESYPYNAGTEIPLSVAIKDGVDVALQTPIVLRDYPIPAEVRALSGYGWSCPSHYNYIDFEAKKFVQNVGSRAYASGDESDATVITDGTTTYYPLNLVIETDISAYLTDDNLIEVESGGTLTFPNSNGTDYQIPIPSSETYMVDLQSALGG